MIKEMRNMANNRPFAFSFIAFLFLLIVSAITSFYVRLELAKWEEKTSQEAKDSVMALADTRMNTIKMGFYGLMSLYQKLDAKSPELITEINKDQNIKDAFGKTHETSVLMKQEGTPLSEREKNAVNQAFSEKRPVFFNRERGENNYLGVVFPVNYANRTFIYADLEYGYLLLPVEKTSILSGTSKYSLKVFSHTKKGDRLVYASGQEEAKPEAEKAYKRYGRKKEESRSIYLDGEEMKFVFEQEETSQIALWSRQIPFTILVMGTILSVAVFGGMFLSLITNTQADKHES